MNIRLGRSAERGGIRGCRFNDRMVVKTGKNEVNRWIHRSSQQSARYGSALPQKISLVVVLSFLCMDLARGNVLKDPRD